MGCNPPQQKRCEQCKHALVDSLALVKRNRVLQKALRFYAPDERYEAVPHMNPMSAIELDRGKRARNALEKTG